MRVERMAWFRWFNVDDGKVKDNSDDIALSTRTTYDTTKNKTLFI